MTFSKKHIFLHKRVLSLNGMTSCIFDHIFAHNFFPTFDKYTGILMTFGVFAAGFFMGPIGSVVMGSIGDRLGRKVALVISVVIMIVPILVIACLPVYTSIGLLAPIILILMRLIQGCSIGGSYGGVMVFMIESAKPNRRGFVASFATMSSGYRGVYCIVSYCSSIWNVTRRIFG